MWDKNGNSGFTIVELLVAIITIGILASVLFVGYSQWQVATITNVLKSDLSGAMSAMKDYRNFHNSYPASVPSNFTASSGVTLTTTITGNDYCITATHSSYPNMPYRYNSANSDGIQSGQC